MLNGAKTRGTLNLLYRFLLQCTVTAKNTQKCLRDNPDCPTVAVSSHLNWIRHLRDLKMAPLTVHIQQDTLWSYTFFKKKIPLSRREKFVSSRGFVHK